MTELGKLLIVVGGLLVCVGALFVFGGKLPWFGHLPGDISIQRGNFSIYFPLATSILVSIVISLLFAFLRR
jgi:membrane protein implicated in regulation of membrane protease activity